MSPQGEKDARHMVYIDHMADVVVDQMTMSGELMLVLITHFLYIHTYIYI